METNNKEKEVAPKKVEVKKEPIEIVLITDAPYTDNYKVTVKDINGYKHNVYIFRYPTNNCQLSTIGQATSLLSVVENRTHDTMIELRRKSNTLVLIDIRSEYKERMLKLLAPYMTIVTETPYHSSNGSNMILYIMRWAI